MLLLLLLLFKQVEMEDNKREHEPVRFYNILKLSRIEAKTYTKRHARSLNLLLHQSNTFSNPALQILIKLNAATRLALSLQLV